MADIEPDVVEITNALLEAAQVCVGTHSRQMPVSAVLIYKTLLPDGSGLLDFKITHDLDMATVAGLTQVVNRKAVESYEDTYEDGWDG